jgi:hypothetical protein
MVDDMGALIEALHAAGRVGKHWTTTGVAAGRRLSLTAPGRDATVICCHAFLPEAGSVLRYSHGTA